MYKLIAPAIWSAKDAEYFRKGKRLWSKASNDRCINTIEETVQKKSLSVNWWNARHDRRSIAYLPLRLFFSLGTNINQKYHRIEKIVFMKSLTNHNVGLQNPLTFHPAKELLWRDFTSCVNEDVSKATELLTFTAILFAEEWCCCVVIDPISPQSERSQIVDEKGKPLWQDGGPRTQHY